METLAYLHCASAYEESPSIELVLSEGNAPVFDGLNWKKFSSMAMLGLVPLAIAVGVFGSNEQAQAYSRCGGSSCYPVYSVRYKTIKIVHYKRVRIHVKHWRCHRRVVKVVCYKCYRHVYYL